MNWFLYEEEYREKGCKVICGIDEAGRGPLFGPVCAAAVILPFGVHIDGLDDSKKLAEKRRETVFENIKKQAVAYAACFASHEEIDSINILNATYLAMSRAYDDMKVRADMALIDGNRIPPQLSGHAAAIVKGDGKSANIAAASIIAKVTRDRMMVEYAQKYPGYGFEKHKGYPTKAHYEAIKKYGILPEHRRSFLKNLDKH